MQNIGRKKQYRAYGSANFNYRSYDTLRLEISIGPDYSEGEKLKAQVMWAKKNFGRVLVLVCDTLNRHNIAREKGIDYQQAYKEALFLGEAWLFRNQQTIKDMQIIRWDRVLNDPDYPDALLKVELLYDNNQEFRKSIDSTIAELKRRKIARGEKVENFEKFSVPYLLEESAGLAVAYKNYPGVSAYGGSCNDPWLIFMDRDMEGVPAGLINSHCVRLRLESRAA
jgi:tRNA-dependent cyclodipeptide synthase